MVDNTTIHTVSELMMVPTGLQTMLCPPESEGHIPQSFLSPFCSNFPMVQFAVAPRLPKGSKQKRGS